MPGHRIDEILYPTDLSESADHALEHLELLAGKLGARVVLYHAAADPDPSQPHWAFGHGAGVWDRIEREARHALHERARRLGVPCEVVVERAPDARRALISLIQARRHDLTLMSRHDRTRGERALAGSATDQMLKYPAYPLLCVRPEQEARPYRRILVPTDLDLPSRLSFPVVACIARAFDASVLLLHVASGHRPQELPTESALIRAAGRDIEGVRLSARVADGAVASTILETARREASDLIAMATRGRHDLLDVILGSRTERVLSSAPCPVLVA
jgi:nucleotide-binding universal stress UspA family protein